MFSKKKIATPEIDKEQLELIKTAQKRIKQKKRLYYHFVAFIFGGILITIINTGLGVGKHITIYGLDWFIIALALWLLVLIYHTFTVFVTNRFMGKEWEQKQLEKLVSEQKQRIEKLKNNLRKEDIHIAKSEVYNETLLIEDTKELDLTIIVAVDENNAIGKDNDLIWHLSDDLKRFKELTSGNTIIMGRKTFESFPKPLPNRKHIVITRQKDYRAPEGVVVVNSIKEALDKVKNDKNPYIIGGGQIYSEALPLANKIELTRVHYAFDEADTFFPPVDTTVWKEIENTFHKKDDKHDYEFSFITYVRN